MNFLEFIFQDVWHFFGMLIIIMVVVDCLAELIKTIKFRNNAIKQRNQKIDP